MFRCMLLLRVSQTFVQFRVIMQHAERRLSTAQANSRGMLFGLYANLKVKQQKRAIDHQAHQQEQECIGQNIARL